MLAFELLHYAISAMCICIHCHSAEVKLAEASREGLGSMCMIQCQNEERTESLSFPCSLKGRFYDVNRRSVLAMRRIGREYSAMQKFCGIMNLPPLSTKIFPTPPARSLASNCSGSNTIHGYCREGAVAGAE